ncbi:MAG TPA: phosphopentomutase [Saprospiraceae bacterium]|nr:phosphopentomutase [Saprospiraceae bacterium]
MIKRVVLIVLDSVGIGALPDAEKYGDVGSNTLDHIFLKCPQIKLPNLLNLGLGNIDSSNSIPSVEQPLANYGKAMEQSAGKDTTTGHWEIAGNILEKPFPVFEDGFLPYFIEKLESEIGRKTIGNYAASGTVIINELGDEHVKTGFPIIYTSADSVCQIAMHEEVIPIEEQYNICKTARKLLIDELEVGRVIARPFIGSHGNYTRTANRKDFATLPPDNLLTSIERAGMQVSAIGKISDIFAGKGITKSTKTKNNLDGILATIDEINQNFEGLIFTNLVDFDMLYGHRRDPAGYASCLAEFDSYIPRLLDSLHDDDLLIITADHGNDPTFTGTDHTREYIPILVFGKSIAKGFDIGVRESFADIAATISKALGIEYKYDGSSFFNVLTSN